MFYLTAVAYDLLPPMGCTGGDNPNVPLEGNEPCPAKARTGDDCQSQDAGTGTQHPTQELSLHTRRKQFLHITLPSIFSAPGR
ncbi:hypothetical protein CCR75_006276 [Bremia lactucae]|uniref:Uncharacterized protein n=1 Tax=Bremia lactucae TaxID=4779 RepID=A0A976FFW8_BRELC|nr:hypothetical protein CCR75_006276 [Bremia lactucae]